MIRYCKGCHGEYESESNRKKICPKCLHDRNVERCRIRRKKIREQAAITQIITGSLPKSALIKGQSMQLSRDVHNSILSGRTYGEYMAMKREGLHED